MEEILNIPLEAKPGTMFCFSSPGNCTAVGSVEES